MKYIIAMMLVLVSLSASAATVSVDVGSQRESVSRQYGLISNVRIQDEQVGVEASFGTVDRVEADYTFNPFKPFHGAVFSVATGVGLVTGKAQAHWTYSVEPKVSVPINDSFTATASYKFRNDLKGNIADLTKTAEIGVDYKLVKNTTVGLKYAYSAGDLQANSVSIGAAYKF